MIKFKSSNNFFVKIIDFVNYILFLTNRICATIVNINIARILKIAAIACYLFLSSSIIISKMSPATQYEASIYSSTHAELWFFSFISIIVGIIIIMHQLYSDEYKTNRLWLAGIGLVFFSYATSISLYIIRGYYLWNGNGDISTHLASINYINYNGYIPSNLFYPITHIYVAEQSQILGINIMILNKLIPLFFGLMYVPFMYLFAKSILPENGQAILATVASAAFTHSWYLTTTPNHLSNLLFPFLLFVLIKSSRNQKMSWKALFLIMAFLYPVLHPVPSIALIILLATMWIPEKIFNVAKKKTVIYSNHLSKINFVLLSTMFVWGISWISSFGVWKTMIKNIYRLINEDTPSHVSELANQVTYAQGYGYNVYEQIFKVMGGSLIYIILALSCFPIIWREVQSKKNIIPVFQLYGPFFTLGLFTLCLFFLNLSFGPLRMIIYIDIISATIVGFILYEIVKKSQKAKKKYIPKFVSVIIIILLVGVSIGGAMKLYPSPYILETSRHTTQYEVEGMDWTFNYRNLNVDISRISIVPRRFAALLLTPEKAKMQNVTYYSVQPIPQFHFGYDKNPLVSHSYENDIYLALTTRDESIYTDIFPDMADIRWNTSDFEKLEHDPSINKLYSNYGFDLWFINI